MGRAERAETTGLHCCAACGGRFEIETTSEAARKRLRCGTCDRYEDVWIVRAVGRWTLVDPSGSSQSFASRAELLAAIPAASLPPAAESSKTHTSAHQPPAERPSAASLLAESMAEAVPVPPSLSTPLALAAPMGVPTSSEPPPPASLEPASLEPASLEPVSIEPVSIEPVSIEPVSIEPVSIEPVSIEPVSIEPVSIEPASLEAPASEKAAAAPAESESAPLTPIAQELAPPQASVSDIIRRPEPRAQSGEEDLEPLSARDVVMVLTPPPRTASVRPTRPPPLPVSVNPPRLSKPPSLPSVPPKAGELASKPLRDPLAPPPPTITVESERPAALRAKLPEAAPASVREAPAKAKEPPITVRSTNDDRPSIKGTLGPEPSRNRTWLIPVVAVAGIGAMVWALQGSTSSSDTSAQVARPEPPATSAPVASIAEAVKPAPAPAPPASENTTTTTTRTMPVAAASPDKPIPAAVPVRSGEVAATSTGAMRLPDLLDRAAAARKAGDHARAKEFYERALAQNASNVEAHSGLGDIARAQGDLAAAKASYEKALDVAPQYMPAMLGLADTEWDLGQREAAQRHYVTLTQLPMQAPERVKQRASAGAAPAATSANDEATSSTASPQAASPKATAQPTSQPAEDTPSE